MLGDWGGQRICQQVVEMQKLKIKMITILRILELHCTFCDCKYFLTILFYISSIIIEFGIENMLNMSKGKLVNEKRT